MLSQTQKLLVMAELTAAKARYCRLLDSKDWAGFGSLMTEDFELDLTQAGAEGLPVIKGREQAMHTIRSSIEQAVTVHQVHSPEFDIKEGEARVIWPMNDRVIWSEDKPSLVGYGHYHERWVLLDGEWKLAAQRLVRLHCDWVPPPAQR